MYTCTCIYITCTYVFVYIYVYACTCVVYYSRLKHCLTIAYLCSQATYSADLPCETVSKINLVDLAGRSVKYMCIIIYAHAPDGRNTHIHIIYTYTYIYAFTCTYI